MPQARGAQMLGTRLTKHLNFV